MQMLFTNADFDIWNKDDIFYFSKFGEKVFQFFLCEIAWQFINKQLIIKVISFYIDIFSTNRYLFQLEYFFACINYYLPTFSSVQFAKRVLALSPNTLNTLGAIFCGS